MGIHQISVCVLLLLFCVFLRSAISFNLEARIPLIKIGNNGSYFGYSVAEHQTVMEQGFKKSWLLVGAPLDQNRQPNTTRSGALWRCPITSATTDCEQVVTDGKRTEHGTYLDTLDSDELKPPHNDEIKDGQWLGVSVRSQGSGGKVVVCAHRYIRKMGDSRFGQGLCYTLDNELNYDNMWEPCKGRSVAREHEEFGYCQVGTSSTLLEDGSLLLGSPGPYTWRGTVFTMDTNDNFLERDKVTYHGPVVEGANPVDKYSYLGMSVVGGRFFGKNMSYVAGAPRADGTGQVVIFSKKAVEWALKSLLNVSLVLNGEQFGSSFGYETAVADVNGDGKTDLLVGAPFYFDRTSGGAVYVYINEDFSFQQTPNFKLTGKPDSHFGFAISNAGDLNKDGCDDIAIGSPYEGNGVVYIYLGHKIKGLDREPKQIIMAEHLPMTLKTFGYSLSGGMDLDANGYPDLLIGAYESHGVALLFARPIMDIKTFIRPNNIIKNVDPSRHGCDLDPTANFTCFSFETCCKIEALVQSTTANYLRLNYVIEAETYPGGKKFSRVFFGENPYSQKSNVMNRTIEMTKDNTFHCEQHTVYIKENTRDIQSPIKFQLNYTLVQAEPVWRPYGQLPYVDDYPVLNATALNMFSATFLNDCGGDGVCSSDLVVEASLLLPSAEKQDSYILTLGQEDEIRLVVTANNLGESAYEARLLIKHHKGLHYIAANVTDKHVICNLHSSTMVSCTLGNPFKTQLPEPSPIILRFDPKSLEDHELSVDFEVWANSTSKEITPDKPHTKIEALVVKNAELSIKGIARPEQVFYGGVVKGESAMRHLDDIGSRVLHTYQVFNEGPWRVTSVQVVVEWPHQVANNRPQGKWLLYPDGLPVVEAQGGGECFLSEKYINPLGLKPGAEEPPLENLIKLDAQLDTGKWSKRAKEDFNATAYKSQSAASENKLRRKRDSEMVVKPEAYTDKDGERHQVVNMNCQKGTAKCLRIRCVVYKLARNQAATITVRARLWNATLVEDYPRVARVNIASTAIIQLPEHYNIHQDNVDDDVTMVETVAYPDLVITEPTGVLLWVIIVAVVAGLVVLILLIFALWKFGFFKRSRPDPTLSGNLEKNKHEGSPFLARDRNSLR